MTGPAISPSRVSGDFAGLISTARQQSASGPAIIAFADSGYVEILMNWLVALAANRIDNFVVIALDEPLHGFLRERRIPVVLSVLDGDLSALWVRRIEVFAALLDAGVNFVHSDVDAVWQRDPRIRHLQDPDCDLVFSQGTVWPPDVHDRFGFVLCCGLFAMRATATTRRLVEELSQDVLRTGDDQVSMNRLIAARSMRWQIEPADVYHLEGGGRRFLCSKTAIRGVGADGLRLSVLPHHLFPRVPGPAGSEAAFVTHPLSAKDPAAKLRSFEQAGCLWLREDWKSIPFDIQSLSRLRRTA